MTTLTLICLSCKGAGTLVGDAPCGICRGTGSVRRSGALPVLPPPTLEDTFRRIRQLEQMVLMLAQVDPPPSLATRRLLVRKLEEELQKGGPPR